MLTLKSSLKVSFVSLILIFSLTEVSLGHEHHSYSHGTWRPVADNPNWMSVLRDDLRLSDLSIPGTHETMSRFGTDFVKTQTMTLLSQLESGIRVLDIRCAIAGNSFKIYHGPIYQEANFDDVLSAVVKFLADHTRETVLMRVKDESRIDEPGRFEDIFRDEYWKRYKAHMWQGKSENPTLGEMRGKIVILQDFARWQCPPRNQASTLPAPEYGLCYSSFAIQDAFYMRIREDLYQKWIYVKNHLAAANSGDHPDTKYMNYLTASSAGVFPYFVVSGHSDPRT